MYFGTYSMNSYYYRNESKENKHTLKVQVGQAFSVLNFGSTTMTQHTPLLLHVINKIENNIHANPIIENLQTLIIIFYISIYGIRKNPQTV